MSERDPLLRITSSSQPTMKPILSRARLLAPINTTHADLTLLACCVVTGMLDCAVFNNYGVFVGMQTGTCHNPSSPRSPNYELTSQATPSSSVSAQPDSRAHSPTLTLLPLSPSLHSPLAPSSLRTSRSSWVRYAAQSSQRISPHRLCASSSLRSLQHSTSPLSTTVTKAPLSSAIHA